MSRTIKRLAVRDFSYENGHTYVVDLLLEAGALARNSRTK